MKSICSVLILFTISLIVNSPSYSQLNSLDINSLDINSININFNSEEFNSEEFDLSKIDIEESKAYVERIIISIFLGVIISISLVIILLNIRDLIKFPKGKIK